MASASCILFLFAAPLVISSSQSPPVCDQKTKGAACADDMLLLQNAANVHHLAEGSAVSGVKSHTQRLSDLQSKMGSLVADIVAGKQTITNTTLIALESIDDEMDNIIANTEKSRSDIQDEVGRVRAVVQACTTETSTSHSQAGGVDELAATVSQDREMHNSCRIDEKALKADKIKKCSDFETYASNLQPPVCMTSYVASSADSNLQCLQTTQTWIATATTTWESMKDLCDIATSTHSTKRSSCTANQASFESGFCSYHTLLSSTCSHQITCRSTATGLQSSSDTASRTSEAGAKAEYASAKHVKCILSVLKSADDDKKSEMLKACNADTQDTSHLDITYPPVPDAATCDTSPIETKPCDSPWLSKEYEVGGATWYADAAPELCTACAAPPPSPTQASASHGPVFKIYAEKAGKWLQDGMNMFANDENSATTWEVTETGGKYTLKALSGTTQYDGKYMQANCGEKQKTAWKDSPDATSKWGITPALSLDSHNTGVTMINENGQHLCSNIHHTNPPTCSYSCDGSWKFTFVSQASTATPFQASTPTTSQAADTWVAMADGRGCSSPETHGAIKWVHSGITLEQCKQVCQDDPTCSAIDMRETTNQCGTFTSQATVFSDPSNVHIEQNWRCFLKQTQASGGSILGKSILLSTVVALPEGKTTYRYSSGQSLTVQGVDFVKQCGNSDADPYLVQYNSQGDTVDLAAFITSGGVGGGLGVDEHGRGGVLSFSGESGGSGKGFGCHANWLITFDLQTIRTKYFAGAGNFRFTGRFGISTRAADKTQRGQGVILCDGVVSAKSDKLKYSDGGQDVTAEVPSSARYLTIAMLNGDESTSWDDQVWLDPTLHEVVG